MDIASFPQLPKGAARKLFFSAPPEFYTELMGRGYEVVLISTLPRGGLSDEQNYLRAKLQGIEEGTIQVSRSQMTALKHELDLVFGNKDHGAPATLPSDDVLETLGWSTSRYTLRGNTTITDAAEIATSGVVVTPPSRPVADKKRSSRRKGTT